MTAQEIFDKVSRHLITQGQQSFLPEDFSSQNLNGCAYRGIEGRMCAAGCLISDEFYCLDMEGKTFRTILPLLPKYLRDTEELISDLQLVHDSDANFGAKKLLKSSLRGVASTYRLSLIEELRDEN